MGGASLLDVLCRNSSDSCKERNVTYGTVERFSGSSGRIGWSSVLLTSGLAVGDTDSLTPMGKDKEAVEGYTIPSTSSTRHRKQLFQRAPRHKPAAG